MQPTLPGVEETVIETVQGHDIPSDPPSIESALTLLDLADERTGAVPPRHRCPLRPRTCPTRDAPLLHAVRRPDAARRLVPRLPELRQHQRLQLTRSRSPH